MPLPDIDSIATYNGATNGTIVDYSPAEDPQTDQPAAGATAQQATTASGTRTAIRAYCTFVYNGSVVSVTAHDAVWGNGTPPVVTRQGTGAYLITWPATVSDPIGGTHTINIRTGWCNIQKTASGAVDLYFARQSANTVLITLLDGSGTLADQTNWPIDAFAL